MFSLIRNLFKKRVWIGTVHARWVKMDGQDCDIQLVYHLFLKGDRRIVKCLGYDAKNHPMYRKYVYPWVNGAPDGILEPVLKFWVPEYLPTINQNREKEAKEAKN